MAQVINTNISSLNAQRNLSQSQASLSTSLQRLSSGLRINSAKDDAAGLAISERMTSQIRGNDQAQRNANDGISLAQTAEGDLNTISNNLQRMRELAVQAANATNSAADRAALDGEVQSLSAEIDRVAKNSSFNGIKLLDGTFSAQTFQVGANNSADDQISIDSISSARTSSLGQYNGFSATSVNIGTASDTAAAQSLDLTGPGTTVSLGTIKNDAKDLVAAINNSGVQGLTATANAATVTGTTTGATAVGSIVAGNVTLTVNGTNITVNTVGNDTTNTDNALAAINAQSANTGVTAANVGGVLKLTSGDGRNITLSFTDTDTTGATLGNFGLTGTNTTTGGTINLNYVNPQGSGITAIDFNGAFNQTYTVGSTGSAISAVNVLTASNATSALSSIDAAINAVNTSRASLGAYQNRFATVVDSLQTRTENLTASKSRITDADFAKETANLTRAQILQQAGTAMLSQANQLPQGVLSLLR
jgi:flagellin